MIRPNLKDYVGLVALSDRRIYIRTLYVSAPSAPLQLWTATLPKLPRHAR